MACIFFFDVGCSIVGWLTAHTTGEHEARRPNARPKRAMLPAKKLAVATASGQVKNFENAKKT